MSTPTFVTAEPFVAGRQVVLGEAAVHHIRVRRLEIGARVALLDGQGGRASGVLVRLAKRNATVEVDAVHTEAAPVPVHLILPIADKERMLWLAEKAAELGASSWRPVQFRRSRSVAARGEGTMFTQKVSARMAGALEQSGNAWLPTIYPDATIDRAVAAAPAGIRIILDGSGEPLARLDALVARSAVARAAHPVPCAPSAAGDDATPEPVTIAVGPEGGIEPDELERFIEGGFRTASVGATVLRFETAAIAALGIVRSLVAPDVAPDVAPESAP